MRNYLEEIFKSAREHAENNPEVKDGATHEVGDLQAALRIAFDLMLPYQHRLLHKRYFEGVHTE